MSVSLYLSLPNANMRSKPFLTALTFILLSLSLSLTHVPFLSCPPDRHSDGSPQVIPISSGPESFAFDPDGGGPYTGISDGRIVRWHEGQRRWVDFAVTSPKRDGCGGPRDHEKTEHVCGRPLGLQFDERTGNLYVADAYMGLLVVGPNGGLATKVATQGHGVPFKLTNALDIDQSNGVVYFTDSSSTYHRRNHLSAILSGDRTGRLLKYDPEFGEVTVLLTNLSFPNGVSLGQSGKFILVAETTACRILRLWLEPPRAGEVEVFSQLPGFPDNIKRNQRGEFWVAMHSRKGAFLEWILSSRWMGKAMACVSPCVTTKAGSYLDKWRGHGLALRLGQDGETLETLEDRNGKVWKCASEVQERDGFLWIGSVRMSFAVKQKV